MDYKLELVPVPVTDVDAAKAFYIEKCGFALDHDVAPVEGVRVVQFTPPGSACSIAFGTGWLQTAPGSVQGLTLVVADIAAARVELVARGLEISEVQDMGGGIQMAFFSDPDGNTWALQEIAADAHLPE